MAASGERPNFLFIIGEDTGRYLACYGDPVAQTPHLDRLASEGCRFDQAWTTSPVCAPSRSALVTGQYPMKIGTHHMRSRLLDPPRLFTHELRDAGYHVSWPTKLDFNLDPTEGWRDDDEMWQDRLRSGDLPDKPWLLYQNIGITHESTMWPDEGQGESRPRSWFLQFEPRPPRQTDPDAVPLPDYLPDTPAVREDIARHYDNIAELDRQMGGILDALAASGQAENTFVIFLADHGRGLPREKRWPYAPGLRMPLIVRGPGIEAGSTRDELVSWTDIAPTILSLAGAEIPESYDGQVFLGPDADEPRKYVFGGRDRMDEAFDRVRVVSDGEWLYVRNFYPQIPYAQRLKYMEHLPTMQELRRLRAAGQLAGSDALFMQETKPEEELYDLRLDARCVNNLADDPVARGRRDRLSAALERWIEEIGDLGGVPERELIERGLVEDQITGHRQSLEPLSPEHRIGPELTVVEPGDLEDGQ